METIQSVNNQFCATDSSGGNTSSNAQRARLLARLKRGPVDTFTVIRELDICRPGARISELRSAGHLIHTQLVTCRDDHGRQHRRVALYCLAEPALSEQP